MGKRLKKSGTNYFVSKLPTYTPSSIITRILIISVVGILTIRFFANITGVPPKEFDLIGYIIIIVSFNLLSESIILVDNILEKYLPIPKKIKLRFIIQTIDSLILITLMYIAISDIMPKVHPPLEDIPENMRKLSLGFGLMFTIFLVSSLLMARMVDKWMFAQREIEVLKQEKIKSDYNALQDQLNPHYLFNNLSALKSLIMYDKDAAVKFTENFTDVYRYVLQSKDKITATLKDELVFMDAYVGLHKERLGEGLQVKVTVNRELLTKEIPPLTIQLLIENAVKHNIAGSTSPLNITVSSKNEYLIVKNNIQLKETSYSTKTGLNNLVKRYDILSEKEVIIKQNEEYFKVKVPLL